MDILAFSITLFKWFDKPKLRQAAAPQMAAMGAKGPDFPYFRQIISVFLLFFTLSLQTPLRYGKVSSLTHSKRKKRYNR